MNAPLRLDVLDNRPQRIDGYYTTVSNDYSWKVRFGYRITKHGVPNSRRFGENNPDADGVPTEVCIAKAWLLNTAETVEQSLPLNIFPLDMLIDAETEIALKIDDGEL